MKLGTIIIGLLIVLKLAGLVYVIIGTMKKKEAYADLEIKPSGINGDGLFAIKSYNKGDVILDDIFPHAPRGFDTRKIDEKKFNKYISLEGTKINHCKTKFNSDLILQDMKHRLVALTAIDKGAEVTANYNRVNQKFPFISVADADFQSC